MALMEIISEMNQLNQNNIVKLEDISSKFLKYYWNQLVIWDLEKEKVSENSTILKIVKEFMVKYYTNKNSGAVELFEYVENDMNENYEEKYEKCVKDIVKIIKMDVSWRFTILDKNNYDQIYDYKKGDDKLVISFKNIIELKKESENILELIKKRWENLLIGNKGKMKINFSQEEKNGILKLSSSYKIIKIKH